MKSRPLTWLLVVLALAVWGVIGWKLLEGPEKPSPPAAGRHRPATLSAGADTLRLDYRDPFLNVSPPSAEKQSDRPSWPAPAPASGPGPDKTDEPAVSCLGRIRKASTDYFLLAAGGESLLLRAGETAGGWTLREAWPDSLRLVRGDRQYIVKYR